MRYLTIEHILQLHSLVLLKDGGADGIRDIGRLESVVASQHQQVFGEELYTSVYEKSAAIMRSIVGDHPFADGNKRTAMLAGLMFLSLNGVSLTLRQGELEDFAVTIATDHLSVQHIAAWLLANSTNG